MTQVDRTSTRDRSGACAAAQADAPALLARGVGLSYAETTACVARVADHLRRERVRMLAIAADNSPDWAIVDLAAQQAGIPTVPLPPFFSPEQLAHVLTDSGADAIAADALGRVLLRSRPSRNVSQLTAAIDLLRIEPRTRGPVRMPGMTAKISYTSGTTGTPKGVCLSREVMGRVAASLRAVTEPLGIRRHLCLLPLATLLENVAGVYAPLLAGAEVAVPSLEQVGIRGATGLDMARLLSCLDEYRPQSIILLPQMLAGLVAAAERGAALPSSLAFVAVGGGVVGLPLLERADRLGIPVYEGYGLTECSSVVALNTPEARRLGSVGRPLPHCRVRIGPSFEVLVSGATMTAYLGDEAPAPEEIATGDVGHFDDDGYLFIGGRRKNVLITSFGRNVSPEWVEASLTATDSIAQAALFGDGRPFNVAVVVARPGVSTDAVRRDVERVNRGLPDYARVHRWVPAAEPFGLANQAVTTNGRIRRSVIGDIYARELAACYTEPLGTHA